jgi:hypothetical protein
LTAKPARIDKKADRSKFCSLLSGSRSRDRYQPKGCFRDRASATFVTGDGWISEWRLPNQRLIFRLNEPKANARILLRRS